MFFTILKLSYINITIFRYKFSFSVFLVISPFSYIIIPIQISKITFTTFLPLNIFSYIKSYLFNIFSLHGHAIYHPANLLHKCLRFNKSSFLSPLFYQIYINLHRYLLYYLCIFLFHAINYF